MITSGDTITVMLKDPLTYVTGTIYFREFFGLMDIETDTEEWLIPMNRLVSIIKEKEVKHGNKKDRRRGSRNTSLRTP